MPPAEAESLICVDVGTTNTRAWSLRGPEVVARVEEGIGARDVARDGHAGGLRSALARVIGRLLEDGDAVVRPSCIAAAGMITSRHGLVEVPYVVAPASATALRAAVKRIVLPELFEIPFALVPGVQTLQRPGAPAGVPASDVMRGEETLCMGLIQLGLMRSGDCLLNLGSHWKLIQVDAEGRIAWSFTSLAGELLHATRRETVLASALPEGSLSALDVPSFEEGMAELRRSGLPRAFFCLRLFELAGGRTASQQLSFALGVLVASDLDAWSRSGSMPRGRVLIAGGDRLGGAWSSALRSAGSEATELSRSDVESGFLAGLRFLAAARD
jgi:2-dehydro-3-deoxygalactonokinase